MAASTTLTAAQRSERARAAGQASHLNPERYVSALEARADRITDEQRERLRRLLER